MEKTAMQMAIDHYKKLSEQGSNQAYVIAKFLEDNFLEIERQQIINTCKDVDSTIFWVNYTSYEEYYNDKFNN